MLKLYEIPERADFELKSEIETVNGLISRYNADLGWYCVKDVHSDVYSEFEDLMNEYLENFVFKKQNRIERIARKMLSKNSISRHSEFGVDLLELADSCAFILKSTSTLRKLMAELNE